MFGAEKFASTRRTFLLKFFDKEIAVSSAKVVFPTPPFIDTNARTLLMLSPNIDEDWKVYKFYVEFGNVFIYCNGCFCMGEESRLKRLIDIDFLGHVGDDGDFSVDYSYYLNGSSLDRMRGIISPGLYYFY